MPTRTWLTDLGVMDGLFRNYKSADTEGPAARESVAAAMNLQGQKVPEFAIPKAVIPVKPNVKRLGELNLLCNQFLLVGQRAASVLKDFDLGEGGLHPVAVLDYSGNTVSTRDMYFWNFGNLKMAFDPSASFKTKKSNYGNVSLGEHSYSPRTVIKDDTIALRTEYLKRPVVWCEK